MSEMIERVARAIAKSQHSGLGWPKKSDPEYMQCVHTYLRDARAAIKAMREPTEEMNRAGHMVFSRVLTRADSIYEAMIDTALKEPTNAVVK